MNEREARERLLNEIDDERSGGDPRRPNRCPDLLAAYRASVLAGVREEVEKVETMVETGSASTAYQRNPNAVLADVLALLDRLSGAP